MPRRTARFGALALSFVTFALLAWLGGPVLAVVALAAFGMVAAGLAALGARAPAPVTVPIRAARARRPGR